MVQYSLLTPIGEHRSNHIESSKGKREKQRKRSGLQANEKYDANGFAVQASTPPRPEITSWLTVGFNSTNRLLERLVKRPSPEFSAPLSEETSTKRQASVVAESNQDHGKSTNLESTNEDTSTKNSLLAVFVPRFDQPSTMHSHLPLLITTASLATPSQHTIRLVSLPKGAEARLCGALQLPRVGLVGLMRDAPNAAPLVDFILENVPSVEIPWLEHARGGQYLPVQIRATQTSDPEKTK